MQLYTRELKSGKTWYCRYTDPLTGQIKTISTGIQVTKTRGRNKKEAEKKALEIISRGKKKDDPLLVNYLVTFWNPGSPYFHLKAREGRPASGEYIRTSLSFIKTHIEPYKPFSKLRLSRLKTGAVEDWKLWMLENGRGARLINHTMGAMALPIREAYRRQEIPADPFQTIRKVREEKREKGILSKAEIQKIITVEEKNTRVKLAVMLAMLAGMRRGEARGLLWKDVDMEKGLIHIRHNYMDMDGQKSPKAGSSRTVLLPETVRGMIGKVRQESKYTAPDDYVLYGQSKDQPIPASMIRAGFDRVLRKIEIDSEKKRERNLTFHGLRHTFISHARLSGISDIEIMALAGHRTSAMMDRYSHAAQIIDFTEIKKKLEKAV